MANWKIVHLFDGDTVLATDVGSNARITAEAYLAILQAGKPLTSLGRNGVVRNHGTIGYWVVREVKEPEVNEFGSVCP